MMFRTHLIASVLIALLFINTFFSQQAIATNITIFLFVVLGGVMPDIDHPKSKLGRKIKIIGFLFEHRGFFHSFIALLGFSFIIYNLTASWNYFSAFFVGYLAHIVLDSLNYKLMKSNISNKNIKK